MKKRVYKEFKIYNLGDYHDLYIQSDTLLLVDVFENVRNKCFEINELNHALFYHYRSKIRIININWYVIDVGKRN